MTRQILDKVVYQQHVYNLAAVSKPLPIRLAYFPDITEYFSTACWRGFSCVYGISQNRLCLIQFWNPMGMEINMIPVIRGRKPKVDMSRWTETGALDLRLAYTGHLLAGERPAPGWRD